MAFPDAKEPYLSDMPLRHGRILAALVPLILTSPFVQAADAAFQVSAMDLDLRFDPSREGLMETATLTLRGEGVSLLHFRIHENLNVERVRADRGVAEHVKRGDRITVLVDPPLEGERRLTFRITGQFHASAVSRLGESAYVLDPKDAWYPTPPVLHAPVTLRAELPEGWGAIAPGTPAGGGAGRGRHAWRSPRPVRAVAFAAADGWRVSEARLAAKTLVVAAPESLVTAEELTPRLADALHWYSGALAPYPYDAFAVGVLDGLPQRVVSSGLMLVAPDELPENRADGGEWLASQWFGEIFRGDGAWVRALAAWQSTVYARDRTLPLPRRIQDARRAYLSLEPGRDVALSRAGRDAPVAVLAGKGSACLDALRLRMGDRKFYPVVERWFREPESGPWSLDALRASFVAAGGEIAGRVFDEWFHRTGIPVLQADLRSLPASSGGWRADLAILQPEEPYTLRLDVVIRGIGGERRESLDISGPRTAVFYILPFRPTRVELDPYHKLFFRHRPDPGSGPAVQDEGG